MTAHYKNESPAVTKKMKNRITGSQIVVIDNRSKAFMADDQNWYSVCDTHGTLVGHPTRKLAEYHAVVPEWCEYCTAIMYETGYFTYTPEDIG